MSRFLYSFSPAGIPAGQFRLEELNMATFTCPYCNKAIEPAAIWCRFCQQVIREDMKKTCPTCDQSILKWSRHCRFCDTSFEVKSPIQTAPKKTFSQLAAKPEDDDEPPPTAGAMVLRRPKNPDGGASDEIELPRDSSKRIT